MKAVIVEIRSDRAAALTEEGQFVSICNSGYTVGQEITLLRRKKKHVFRQNMAAAAAAAVLVLSAGGGGLAYAMPYGTVSVDVNPSIEYTINCFDRVLKVSGVNEDGRNILEQIESGSLLNKKVDRAVSMTIDQLRTEGYLTESDSGVVVSAGTGSEAHSEALARTIEESITQTTGVYSVAVSREDVRSAHEMGTTAGKMRLVRELEETKAGAGMEESFDEREWIGRPVEEILQELKTEECPEETEQAPAAPAPGGETLPAAGRPEDSLSAAAGNSWDMPRPGQPGQEREAGPEGFAPDALPGTEADDGSPAREDPGMPGEEMLGEDPPAA